MANNDQILLDQIIEEQRLARMPSTRKSEFFELYTAEQILKDFDLSDDQFEYGLVGSPNDGGIDSIYTFANGELVQEDFDHTTLKKAILIEVVIVQAKLATGFDEGTLHKFTAATSNLFDLAKSAGDFVGVYSEGLLSAVENFRRIYTGLAGRFPDLVFRFAYATRGDSLSVHPNVQLKVEKLKETVSNLFGHAKFQFQFLGAADLLGLARQKPITSHGVEYAECLTAKDGYIALVRLNEFIKFIRSKEGNLKKGLFEANVRDYQGSNQVNDDMQKSLREFGKEDFWWLNNGVTIVSSKAVQDGKFLTIEDPQIVNGQQTSTEIFNYFKNGEMDGDARSVMVRVIVANDAASRDRIIKATNSQTSIPAASLRATDKIHRDIEAYLEPFGIYYDRRKNSQKQLGRPVDKIISIALLAQAVMAIGLQRPADARARPSSLIKNETEYNKLFGGQQPIALYLVAARITKSVHAYLRTKELVPKDRNNLLFYVVMHLSACMVGKAAPGSRELADISTDAIDEIAIDQSLKVVESAYIALGGNDQVAKGTLLSHDVKNELLMRFPMNAVEAHVQLDLLS